MMKEVSHLPLAIQTRVFLPQFLRYLPLRLFSPDTIRNNFLSSFKIANSSDQCLCIVMGLGHYFLRETTNISFTFTLIVLVFCGRGPSGVCFKNLPMIFPHFLHPRLLLRWSSWRRTGQRAGETRRNCWSSTVWTSTGSGPASSSTLSNHTWLRLIETSSALGLSSITSGYDNRNASRYTASMFDVVLLVPFSEVLSFCHFMVLVCWSQYELIHGWICIWIYVGFGNRIRSRIAL